MMRCLALAVVVVLAGSCVLDAGLEFPQIADIPVLNGILHPDSTIRVDLSISSPLSDTGRYAAVDNAIVQLFQDDQLLAILHSTGDGVFSSNIKPTQGHRYRVTADIPGFPLIEAEDQMPEPPKFEACFNRDEAGRRFFSDVAVLIDLQTDKPAFHWLELISNDYPFGPLGLDSTRIEVSKFSYLYSDSPYLDNFNGIFDQQFGTTEYAYYLRIDPVYQTPTIKILGGVALQSSALFRYYVLSDPGNGQSLILNIYACSDTFDKYLKSTMIDFVANELTGIPIPFSGPVKIHSNVKNGTGVFAAVNYGQVKLEDHPCH